jgi:hypothetical protein
MTVNKAAVLGHELDCSSVFGIYILAGVLVGSRDKRARIRYNSGGPEIDEGMLSEGSKV